MRELHRLEGVGILKSRRIGRQVLYAMNPRCSVCPELTMLITKTVGIVDLVREELAPLADRIELAYIYGSFAAGGADTGSDVDVMVVGDVGMRALATPLRRMGEKLAREVNATVYSPEAYRDELGRQGSFVARVHGGPRIPPFEGHDGPG